MIQLCINKHVKTVLVCVCLICDYKTSKLCSHDTIILELYITPRDQTLKTLYKIEPRDQNNACAPGVYCIRSF